MCLRIYKKDGISGGMVMIKSMVPVVFFFTAFSFVFCAAASAQLAPFNDKGVAIGHVHYLVKDPAAHKKLWIN